MAFVAVEYELEPDEESPRSFNPVLERLTTFWFEEVAIIFLYKIFASAFFYFEHALWQDNILLHHYPGLPEKRF